MANTKTDYVYDLLNGIVSFCEKEKLTYERIMILAFLSKSGPSPQKEIMEGTRILQASLVANKKYLTEAGLVDTAFSEEDLRIRLTTITPKGQETVDRFAKEFPWSYEEVEVEEETANE